MANRLTVIKHRLYGTNSGGIPDHVSNILSKTIKGRENNMGGWKIEALLFL